MIQVENKTRLGDAFVEVNHWEVLAMPLKFALGASPIPEKLGSFKTKADHDAYKAWRFNELYRTPWSA
jgi:hypothetical protein